MSNYLNIRKLVTEEFQKEWVSAFGRKLAGTKYTLLKDQFNIRQIQIEVDNLIQQADDPEAIRKYHRLNLRYLAKYFASTLVNQVKANDDFKASLLQSLTVFKSNPQYTIYASFC